MDEIKKNEQYELYNDLEMPLSLILAEMEAAGIKLDTDRLQKMGEEFKLQLAAIEEKIYQLAGETFNINSPKQLGSYIVEKRFASH